MSRILTRAQAENERRLIAFLREHPLSTAEEINAALGPTGLIGRKYIRGKMYKGQWVWRLNHPKLRRDGLL